MSNEITHEGKTYILKSQVESMIKERVSKVASKATEYQTQLETMKTELDSLQQKNASVDLLQEQLSTLKQEYERSQGRFERYKNVSKYGLTDPQIIKGIEWAYNESQEGLSKKDQISFNEFIENAFNNPEEAPIMIRPHIQALKASSAPIDEVQDKQQLQALSSDIEAKETPIYEAPKTNNGVQAVAPMNSNLINKALNDPEVYEANREQIKSLWYSQFKR